MTEVTKVGYQAACAQSDGENETVIFSSSVPLFNWKERGKITSVFTAEIKQVLTDNVSLLLTISISDGIYSYGYTVYNYNVVSCDQVRVSRQGFDMRRTASGVRLSVAECGIDCDVDVVRCDDQLFTDLFSGVSGITLLSEGMPFDWSGDVDITVAAKWSVADEELYIMTSQGQSILYS